MEWLEAMSKATAQQRRDNDEEMVDDDDFYAPPLNINNTTQDASVGAAQPGAGMTVNAPSTFGASNAESVQNMTLEQRKLENQKKAEQLRAKLMANRQNTPIRANTSNKAINKPNTPQQKTTANMVESTPVPNGGRTEPKSDASAGMLDVDKLLQEGKAAADAKAKEEGEARAKAKAKAEASVKADLTPTTTQTTRAAEPTRSTAEAQPVEKVEAITPRQTQQPEMANFGAEYYADLAIWLEVTGYHDIDYRNSKLRTYKERKSLEEEAARIQEKLEKLRQTEQAEMDALRAGSAHPVATPSRPPPPALPLNNGVKRAHSPEPMPERNACPREDGNGIRIRGANDSPQDRPRPNARGRAGSPLGRRVSYPDARRNSVGEGKGRISRDPSLERRQAYYGRDDEGAGASAGQPRRYDAYQPRENGGRGRLGYSAVHVPQERYRDPRGIRDVDTGRGGKKYPPR